MALSIVTLKDKPDHQALWWKLVDAHGQSTGPMRYSQLWYSFQKIIEFTEEHHLNFDLDALTRYLEKTPNSTRLFFWIGCIPF